MDKWIESLKEKASKQSYSSNTDGYLIAGDYEHYGPRDVEYDPNVPEEIDLCGTFDINELELLVKHMKKYNKQ